MGLSQTNGVLNISYFSKKVIEWQKKNPEKTNSKQRRWYAKTKSTLWNKILDHYGHKCNCKNCPETNEKFLTLEHKDNNGSEHRKNIKGHKTLNQYKDVISKNYPEEYEILCLNCNWGRNAFGKCPHDG